MTARACALKINGVFLGFTDGYERFVELDLRDGCFCELIPTDKKFLPLVFTLTENITAAPPDGVLLYLLPDALAVYADKFFAYEPTLRLIAQEKNDFANVTVFSQGLPQILWEDGKNNRVIALDERFSVCTAHSFLNAVLIEGQGATCALSSEGDVFFYGEINEWTYDKTQERLRILSPVKDFGGRTQTYEWDCMGAQPKLKSRTISPTSALPEKFILCEFLQNLLLGVEVKDLLSEELYENLESLKTFLGEYEQVSPISQYAFGAAVAQKKRESVYQIKHFSAEILRGKICNVIRKA